MCALQPHQCKRQWGNARGATPWDGERIRQENILKVNNMRRRVIVPLPRRAPTPCALIGTTAMASRKRKSILRTSSRQRSWSSRGKRVRFAKETRIYGATSTRAAWRPLRDAKEGGERSGKKKKTITTTTAAPSATKVKECVLKEKNLVFTRRVISVVTRCTRRGRATHLVYAVGARTLYKLYMHIRGRDNRVRQRLIDEERLHARHTKDWQLEKVTLLQTLLRRQFNLSKPAVRSLSTRQLDRMALNVVVATVHVEQLASKAQQCTR